MKKVFILVIAISLFGCSSLKTMINEINEKKYLELNYLKSRFEKINEYKKQYKFYEVEDNKIKRFYILPEKRGRKITNDIKIITEPFIGKDEIGLFGSAGRSYIIYEKKQKRWQISYKVKGIKYTTDSMNYFKFEITDLFENKEVKTELEPINYSRRENVEIPNVLSIENKYKKIEFKYEEPFDDTELNGQIFTASDYAGKYGGSLGWPDKADEIKVFRDGEEIAIIVLRKKGGGLFIKDNTDEELKSFLLKTTLMLDFHKGMRKVIQKEFDK